MRIVSALVVGFALLCAPASAQTQPDPILTHYRAYNAALDRRDLEAAEREAALALAASEAANGLNTAVLAFNLAQVRVWRGDVAEALAPAQLALELSETGAQGVDADYATLLLGRAELAASGQAGADRLGALFARADFALLSDEAYAAAAQLGAWALSQQQFELSRQAWSIAQRYADGSPYGESMGSANAMTWQAAALLSAEFERPPREFSVESAQRAYALLNDARELLAPLTAQEAPGRELTVSQLALAQVIAWRAIVHVKICTDNSAAGVASAKRTRSERRWG